MHSLSSNMKSVGSLLYTAVLQFLIFCQIHVFSNAEPLYGDLHSAIAPINNHMTYIALIVNKNKANTLEYHLCTGTLVTREKVLTAASCLEQVPSVGSLQVIFGTTNDYSHRHKKFNVLSKYTYQDWCKNYPGCFFDRYTDDLCVLTLDNIVDGIVPAALATLGYRDSRARKLEYPTPGTLVKLIGWGHTSNIYFPKLPHKGIAVLLSKSQCEQRVQKLIPSCLSGAVLQERVLCAVGDPPILAVHGDYGGPVLNKKDRSVSAIIIQRCPMYHPRDIGPNQVNLLLHLAYYRNYLGDALQ